LYRDRGGLAPGVDAELVENAGDVRFDGPWGEEQCLGYLRIGLALGEK
jgi:hypothetical protein